MCNAAAAAAAFQVVGTTSSVIGGNKAAAAQRKAGKFNEKIADNNAFIQRELASDARNRGEINEGNVRQKVGAFKADQRARILSGGGTLTGSNAAILDDTDTFGELDALMIRSNSEREAWEHEANALNFEAQGDLARIGGNNAATSTILGTTNQVAQQWYSFSNAKGG